STEAPKHRSTEAPKHRSTEAPKHRPYRHIARPATRGPIPRRATICRLPAGRGPATKAPPTTARRERAPQALLIR
ncbi:acetate permease, partial [Burkholderia thailandensis]